MQSSCQHQTRVTRQQPHSPAEAKATRWRRPEITQAPGRVAPAPSWSSSLTPTPEPTTDCAQHPWEAAGSGVPLISHVRGD